MQLKEFCFSITGTWRWRCLAAAGEAQGCAVCLQARAIQLLVGKECWVKRGRVGCTWCSVPSPAVLCPATSAAELGGTLHCLEHLDLVLWTQCFSVAAWPWRVSSGALPPCVLGAVLGGTPGCAQAEAAWVDALRFVYVWVRSLLTSPHTIPLLLLSWVCFLLALQQQQARLELGAACLVQLGQSIAKEGGMRDLEHFTVMLLC